MGYRMMVDIETLDSAPTAAIIQIGAAMFSTEGVIATFTTNVDQKSSIAGGGTTSMDTIEWWSNQPQKAKEALLSPDPIPLPQALRELFEFYNRIQLGASGTVWSHGSSFDLVIIDQAARRVGKRTPWHFAQFRDTRTAYGLCPDVLLKDIWTEALRQYPDKHQALSDAERQIYVLLQVEKFMGLTFR